MIAVNETGDLKLSIGCNMFNRFANGDIVSSFIKIGN